MNVNSVRTSKRGNYLSESELVYTYEQQNPFLLLQVLVGGELALHRQVDHDPRTVRGEQHFHVKKNK